MITGVDIKKLKVYKDNRGFFCELIRSSDKFFKGCRFRQLSHSRVKKGVFKAWHLHKKQTDWLYVAAGDILLVLYDTRKNSKTYKNLVEIKTGEKFGRQVIKIPPGVTHGYKVVNCPAEIIYLMNREYDSKDELRINHNDSEIGYDWKTA